MAGSLPTFQSNGDTVAAKEFNLMQTKWAGVLNPFLRLPTNNAAILEDVTLGIGVNVINHLLGRQMQGWKVVDINASATIYRSAPFNNKTLTLTSNAVATISLEVF